MTKKRKGTEDREIPKILERVKPLRRILQPTEHEEAALKTLRAAAEDRSLTRQASARLAALKIVRQSFTDYVASSGDFSHGPELGRVLATLRPGEGVPVPPELAERFGLALHTEKGFDMLEKWMMANLERAEQLEGDLKRQGVTLDPIRPSRSTVQTGRRGSPPTLLTETVKALLHERYPEWTEGQAFPGRNTQSLRNWLNSRLMAVLGSRESGLEFGALLFDIEDIDPRLRGPLYNIVNHLRNPGR